MNTSVRWVKTSNFTMIIFSNLEILISLFFILKPVLAG